jgi:hypothetical protein
MVENREKRLSRPFLGFGDNFDEVMTKTRSGLNAPACPKPARTAYKIQTNNGIYNRPSYKTLLCQLFLAS